MPLLYPSSGTTASIRENVAVGEVLADVYLPAATPASIVFLIHGGPIPQGAQMKNIPLFRGYGNLLASEGFTAVTFGHRYYAANDFAQSAADVNAVIDAFRGDSNDVVLWVFSGSGPLLTLGFDKSYVRALIDYYAVLDGPAPFDAIARAAEIRVPMLIARAGRDMAQVNEPLSRFLDAAFAHGVDLELLSHAEGEHGFDLVTDDKRTRQIIGRTLAFLRER
jgi:dienelactone hydrolase